MYYNTLNKTFSPTHFLYMQFFLLLQKREHKNMIITYGNWLTPPLLSPDAIGEMERWTLRNLLLVSFIVLLASLFSHFSSASPILLESEVWLGKTSPQPELLHASSIRLFSVSFCTILEMNSFLWVGPLLERKGAEEPDYWRDGNYHTLQLLKH